MQSEVLRVGGRQVRCWRGGEGPPLVLLHGDRGDASRHWSAVWERLGERYEIIAPDLPGFGESAPLPLSNFRGLVGWLDTLLDVLGQGAVRLVGVDFGATLARAYAASHPLRCDGLVLINGGGAPTLADRILRRTPAAARRPKLYARGPGPDGRIPTAPTLVLWSDGAWPAPAAEGLRLAARLPGAAFRLMPGPGHLPQVEAPQATAESLLAFLG